MVPVDAAPPQISKEEFAKGLAASGIEAAAEEVDALMGRLDWPSARLPFC